jgi:TfoX/Sxy family transcriptional regulator of competence genes
MPLTLIAWPPEAGCIKLIATRPNIEKKKMFGGVCYLAQGNICFGIWQEALIVRIDSETATEQLQKDYVCHLMLQANQ